MPTPDVVVNISGASGNAAAAGDIDQTFMAVPTQRGPITGPVLQQSLNDFALASGVRQTTSTAYDSSDTYYSEGGSRLWVQRVASATAAQATLSLVDSSGFVSLIAKPAYQGQSDPGTWANGSTGGLSVAVVVSSGTFQIQTSLGGSLVEASPYFSSQADAIGWSTTSSSYIVLSLGASVLLPVAAASAPLAGGSDGATLADADYANALAAIPSYLGPGQIMAPGRITATGGLQLLAHAIANNRFALIDGADTPTAATLIAAAAGLYGAPLMARRWGQMLAPWDEAPGLTTYTERDVPPCARLAAEYSRLGSLGNPNQAAAGRYGTAQWIQDLSQPSWNQADRTNLNAAGVTVSRRRFPSLIKTYGMRTLADPVADQNWSMAANVRAIMWFAHQAKIIGEAHNFDNIDPFGHELAAYQGDLMGAANTLAQAGALWYPSGNKADAISVDVTTPNTPLLLSQGYVTANVKLRMSPTPEQAIINIVKVPMADAI
jgi:hypothetical protein